MLTSHNTYPRNEKGGYNIPYLMLFQDVVTGSTRSEGSSLSELVTCRVNIIVITRLQYFTFKLKPAN